MEKIQRLGLTLLCICWGMLAWGQAPPEEIQLVGQLTDCETNTLMILKLDGAQLRPLAQIPLYPKDSIKVFNVSLRNDFEKGFYFFGNAQPQSTKELILGGEPVVQVQGACPTLAQAQVISQEHAILAEATKTIQDFQKADYQLMKQYRGAGRNEEAKAQIRSACADIDSQKISFLQQIEGYSPFLRHWAGIQLFKSYLGSAPKGQAEGLYLAEHFFEFTDFSNPAFNSISKLNERIRLYASTIGKVGLSADQQIMYAEQVLDQLPPQGGAYKTALQAFAQGFKGINEDAFSVLAQRYLTELPNVNPNLNKVFQKELARVQPMLLGQVAPDFSLPNVAGDTLSLSDLRGKVVLIDFWASWCGPCRRENPNVKRIYDRFHDQGFEILGVSLDKRREAWEKAIADDKLTWPHVSDLSGWSSVAGRQYGVSSIPYTVLLDEQGRIIGKKLRGKALEDRLEQLFEEGR